MTCRRFAELISWELDTDLPLHQRARLGFHALVCGACRRFRRQLGEMDEAVGQFVASPRADDRDATLPRETKDRLRAVILAHLDEDS
jgi:predicted anti-sigma-YlaC factor YlaD